MLFSLAEDDGVEPPLSGSKPDALPLHQSPVNNDEQDVPQDFRQNEKRGIDPGSFLRRDPAHEILQLVQVLYDFFFQSPPYPREFLAHRTEQDVAMRKEDGMSKNGILSSGSSK